MRFFVLPACLLHCAPLTPPRNRTAPTNSDALLADKGLIGQLQQVRQKRRRPHFRSGRHRHRLPGRSLPPRRQHRRNRLRLQRLRARHVQPDGRPPAAAPRRRTGRRHPEDRPQRTQARRPGVLQHHAPRLQPCRHLCRRRQVHPFAQARRRGARRGHERRLLAAPLQRRPPRAGGAGRDQRHPATDRLAHRHKETRRRRVSFCASAAFSA